mmetsp:Transcript_15107/g.42612  ORF Transcript_15107/g.42612 Transcript_15107/m.42612 type:complete len:164 (+) Transcript_15107:74-565(+)
MGSFLTENKDFVLKLRIEVDKGMTEIRRVKLPRIADERGSISYEKLVGLIEGFIASPGGCPPQPFRSENHWISLTYKDVDHDEVTIASVEELVDAMEQYMKKRVLKIATRVRPLVQIAPDGQIQSTRSVSSSSSMTSSRRMVNKSASFALLESEEPAEYHRLS